MITRYEDISVYVTKDGSQIRELMHPTMQGNIQQSLAEAIIPIGFTTYLHKHLISEEIYHIIEGKGMMVLGNQQFGVTTRDTIYIPPQTAHQIKNIGNIPLKILCCCTPAYSHEDTVLIYVR